MAFNEADLRMADNHVAQGERHVARQLEIIAWLRERGHPTETAENLLTEFRSTLVQHRTHRDLMRMESEPDPLRPKPREQAHPQGIR